MLNVTASESTEKQLGGVISHMGKIKLFFSIAESSVYLKNLAKIILFFMNQQNLLPNHKRI